MIELFRRAGAHAARTAFRTPAGDTAYAALLQRSAAIAQALLAGGDDLGEERIAFMLPAGAEYAAAQWGIWRAGGIALALNAGAAAGEIEHMLAHRGHTTRDRARRTRRRRCRGLRGARASHARRWSRCRAPAIVRCRALGPERRAMIVFTSGTTSKPKGVVSTHGVSRRRSARWSTPGSGRPTTASRCSCRCTTCTASSTC